VAQTAQQPPSFSPCLLWPLSPISAAAELLSMHVRQPRLVCVSYRLMQLKRPVISHFRRDRSSGCCSDSHRTGLLQLNATVVNRCSTMTHLERRISSTRCTMRTRSSGVNGVHWLPAGYHNPVHLLSWPTIAY